MTHRQPFTTPAVLLRKVTYGESDVVAAFFSLSAGKISCFAKAAKYSMKRFGGGLESFHVTDITVETPRRGDLYLLKESSLRTAFEGIRTDPIKTASAGYWCELIERWLEPALPSPRVFQLLSNSLEILNEGKIEPEAAGILFQIHLLKLLGLSPELSKCQGCGTEANAIKVDRLGFDLEKGGLLCHKCRTNFAHVVPLSKGTAMQLKWLQERDFSMGQRARFSRQGLREGTGMLEAFVPRHMGCHPKSLRVLTGMRDGSGYGRDLELPGKSGGTGEMKECPM